VSNPVGSGRVEIPFVAMSKLPSFCWAICPGQSRTTSSTLNPIASSWGCTGTAARYSHSMSRLVTSVIGLPS
jgi:hypothetical protein